MNSGLFPATSRDLIGKRNMRPKIKHTLGAVAIFLSSGLYFFLAYIGYQKQYIQLDTLEKYTGIVESRGITTRKSGKHDATVFYIRLAGLKQTLGIYRMKKNYDELIDELQPGEEVTVYYIPRLNDDVNIDLVQIEKERAIVVAAEEYKKKESALIYLGLAGALFSVAYSIWHYRKKVWLKRKSSPTTNIKIKARRQQKV